MSACYLPGCSQPVAEEVRGALCCHRHAILRRAGWRCEAIIADRRPWVDAFVRCPIIGSEVDAYDGEARCPRHANAR